MEKSVQEYIIKSIFPYTFNSVMVKSNHFGNGFIVGIHSTIVSSVFDNLFKLKSYLKKHHLTWYVGMYEFDSGKLGEIPCISFYEVEDDEDE